MNFATYSLKIGTFFVSQFLPEYILASITASQKRNYSPPATEPIAMDFTFLTSILRSQHVLRGLYSYQIYCFKACSYQGSYLETYPKLTSVYGNKSL